jgi:hypothetical protein
MTEDNRNVIGILYRVVFDQDARIGGMGFITPGDEFGIGSIAPVLAAVLPAIDGFVYFPNLTVTCIDISRGVTV